MPNNSVSTTSSVPGGRPARASLCRREPLRGRSQTSYIYKDDERNHGDKATCAMSSDLPRSGDCLNGNGEGVPCGRAFFAAEPDGGIAPSARTARALALPRSGRNRKDSVRQWGCTFSGVDLFVEQRSQARWQRRSWSARSRALCPQSTLDAIDRCANKPRTSGRRNCGAYC